MTNRPLIYIDDDEDDRMLFEEAIDELFPKMPLESYDNAVKFLERLSKDVSNLPKLIFLDLNMPLLTGFECLKRIRKNMLFSDIPVIIYSTSNNVSDKEKCIGAGANMFVTKSKSFDEMKQMLTEIVDKFMY
ncbi:response regulator [Zobellia alginiliquefaciens]|uniref:response regulator n=1 Tax=Zobellia alginiliquefaciens TaxID=3032586 RepID=UPI0023E42A67|nr:response regulator [Zobellia alginiliquefaciens]